MAAARTLLLSLLAALLLAAPAGAVIPEHVVGGPSSSWFSGSLIQQPGTNCSILGSSYPEIMVSGIGSYGGRQGVVKAGDQYWTAMLLSVPGNPCGVGSSAIATDLILPKGTQIDGSRPIRCFYLSRNATSVDQFAEVTGQQWSAFGSSGEICPAQASVSGRHAGAYSIGFRPLASGAQLQIFVPVVSTTTLAGMGGPDKFSWLTDATGVYANPGLSEVWANVFTSGGSQPFVYFARTPSAIPFWKADAQDGLRNRVEFFANFYVAQQGGEVTFEIRRLDTNTVVGDSSTPGTGWTSTVPSGRDLLQVVATGEAKGPNGGYVPFAFSPDEWNLPMRITWRFDPTGAAPPVTGSQEFRTLAGPDGDADGVADAADACPAVKGTGADGCLPAAPPDPDGDQVFGDLDRCPAQAAPGVLDGCPPGGSGPPPETPAPPGSSTPHQLVAAARLKAGTRFKAAALRKGARVRVTCSQDATATATLTVTGKARRTLGSGVVARASAPCTAAAGGSIRLKPAGKVLKRIGRLRKPVAATLTVSLSAPGATAGSARTPVKLG